MSKLKNLLASEYEQRILELDKKVKLLNKSLKEKEQIVSKQATKHNAYIVEPAREGDKVFIHKQGETILISNGGRKYNSGHFDKDITALSAEDFILSAYFNEGKLMITDAIYFKNKDLSSSPLYKRKKLLKGFCWENMSKDVLLNEYTIVKSTNDLRESCKFYSLDHKRVVVKNYDEVISKDNNSFVFEDKMFELKKLLSLDKETSIELERFSDHKVIEGFVNIIGSSKQLGANDEVVIQLNTIKPAQELTDIIETSISTSMGEQFNKKIFFVWGDIDKKYDSICKLYDLCLVRSEPKISSIIHEDKLMKPFVIPSITTKITKNEDLLTFLKTTIKKLIFEKNEGEAICIHKNGDDFKVFSSNGKEITDLFVPFKDDIIKLTKQDIIVLGGAILDGKVVKQIILWDVVFFNKPLFDTKLYERKKALNALSFSDKLTRADTFVIANEEEFKIAFEALNGKFVLKRWDGPYKLGVENKRDVLIDINN